MTNEIPQAPSAVALKAALAQFSTVLKACGDAVDKYRNECLQRGYSTATSEAMAITVHDHLMGLTMQAALSTMQKEMAKNAS